MLRTCLDEEHLPEDDTNEYDQKLLICGNLESVPSKSTWLSLISGVTVSNSAHPVPRIIDQNHNLLADTFCVKEMPFYATLRAMQGGKKREEESIGSYTVTFVNS